MLDIWCAQPACIGALQAIVLPVLFRASCMILALMNDDMSVAVLSNCNVILIITVCICWYNG